MSKYSQQFKLEVVQDFLKSGGLRRVAHLYSISHSDVKKWALAYQAEGTNGLNRKRQTFTPQFKVKVLKYMEKHHLSARPATSFFKIGSMSTILHWQKLYNEGGIAALQKKPKGRPPMSKHSDIKELMAKPLKELSHEDLLRKAQYLEIENAYLKKLEALAQQKYLAKKSKSK